MNIGKEQNIGIDMTDDELNKIIDSWVNFTTEDYYEYCRGLDEQDLYESYVSSFKNPQFPPLSDLKKANEESQ